MAANTMPSAKSKGNSSQSLHGQIIDVIVARMAAFEANVERLESQVVKLQSQLQGSVKTSVPSQTKATEPATPKQPKSKSPLKAAAVPENRKPQGSSKKQIHDTPSKILIQQQKTNLLIDLTPKREEDIKAPLAALSKFKKSNVVSSCAFVKVFGPMGSCEVGTISTAVDHIASLQLDIDTDDAGLWISSSLQKASGKRSSARTQDDDLRYLEMGVLFRSSQIVPQSLQFGRVVDTLLLPLTILDQLEDPNEVPHNLYFMTWKYYGCCSDGFDQFQTTHATFDQKDRIMKLYRNILGHRQTVHVWFIADAENVEESFEWLRARCYRETARDWQPCSGHGGKHEEYCPNLGKNRKGVVQFLQQSAPPS